MADHDDNNTLTVETSDVLRLIQAHLTEAGLHEACRALRQESGVGLAAAPPHSPWQTWSEQGQWASILKALDMMDMERCLRYAPGSNQEKQMQQQALLVAVHEMTILEVAAVGDLAVAYATLRLSQPLLSKVQVSEDEMDATNEPDKGRMTRDRWVEQKLAALASAATSSTSKSKQKKGQQLPDDYWGPHGVSRHVVRQRLGRQLQEMFGQVKHPPQRLNQLLQQAIKFQSYTGEIPKVHATDDAEEEADLPENQDEQPKQKKRRKVFDLVLGTTATSVEPPTVGDKDANDDLAWEPTPGKPAATISFGKRAFCQAASFLPDASGFVTGSSDGLLEVWQTKRHRYDQLRTDLPYQAPANDNDDDVQETPLLAHDDAITALTVSNDGTMLASGSATGQVKIWRLDNGKCLRTMACHAAAVTSLALFPDATRVLTASQDGTCRAFGLRTARMLHEFTGHASYVHTCIYQALPLRGGGDEDDDDDEGTSTTTTMVVVTACADGHVRLFDAKTAACLCTWRPAAGTDHAPPSFWQQQVGTSIRVAASDAAAVAGGRAVHTVLPLHTPRHCMILVPRGPCAYLVSATAGEQGVVLRVFVSPGARNTTATSTTSKGEAATAAPPITRGYCAGAVCASNKWLYLIQDDGVLDVFEVCSGRHEKSMHDFGTLSTRKSGKEKHLAPNEAPPLPAEITSLVCHPHKSNIVAAFSNDQGQKRGQVVVWK